MQDGVSHPEGQLLGHTEGVTHVSARGDGIHLISNAKDSTVRLWDLRKMTPGSQSVPRSETVRSHPSALIIFPFNYTTAQCHVVHTLQHTYLI